MDHPQKRQRSWLSGITSLVGGGRSSVVDSPSTSSKIGGGDRPRMAPAEIHTPSRPSNVFRAPSPDSPESPVRRASPSLLAQRKMLDRPQGPSTKLGANLPRTTNFSASTTPRSFLRGSALRETPTFSFTPRVPANTLRASFPPETPGRSYRASAAEFDGRGMSKTSSSDLFRMKIPEPDPTLTGEAIAKQVPDNSNRSRSVYADEYLAHLCPPEFNEVQKNQFFCILDLRRLKYAADEIFVKKDWKLNVLNFAKEFEKSRSLIMLRYGLYEFKSVKVSEEVLQKWKMANNIPVFEKDGFSAAKASVNGTQGILGKRKPQNEAPPATSARDTAPAVSQHKRARTAEVREPLAETTTPALNSGNKRKAPTQDNVNEQNPPSKIQKTPKKQSASRTFFEQVANTPAKETDAKEAPISSAAPPSIQVSKPTSDAYPSSKAKFQGLAQPLKARDALARSVLEGGLKAGSTQSSNIFGYLSDASSAKGSGNENADADGEDTEDTEEEDDSEPRDASQSDEPSVVASGGIATPHTEGWLPPSKGTGGIAGSSTSSEASEAPASKSLLDRINRDGNGEPIRVLAKNATVTKFGSTEPSERAPSPERAASPEKPPSTTPVNNTWKTDSPIKFATELGFKPSSSIFGAKPSTASGPGFTFGAVTTAKVPEQSSHQQSKEPSDPDSSRPQTDSLTKPSTAGGDTPLTAPEAPEAPKAPAPAVTNLFGQLKEAAPKPEEKVAEASSTSIFASTTSVAKNPVFASKDLFGNAPTSIEAKAAPPQTSKPLFGGTTQSTPATAKPSGNTPLFGASPMKSGDLFGATGTTSVNGEQSQMKAPFGGLPDTASSSIFKPGSNKVNGIPESDKGLKPTQDKPSFPSFTAPAGDQKATPLFGAASASGTQPNIFGAAPAPPAAPGPVFSFGGSQPSGPNFSFGASAPSDPPQSNVSTLFGGGISASAPSSFTFNANPTQEGHSFHNPFATGDSAASSTPSFDFGSSANGSTGQAGSGLFQFGAGGNAGSSGPATGASSAFTFGGAPPATGPSPAPPNLFGAGASGGNPSISFGGQQQPSGSIFAQQKAGPPSFNFVPPGGGTLGGTSTGTNTPFTFGGASSLATTPATGTPEPGAVQDHTDQVGQQADGDERPQEQISLTEGGPGEEDESVVHEVRAKALRLVTSKEGSDSESTASKDKKSPWKTQGVGPLRILKHKTTGAVRLLLRAEPRGHVALNKALLPNFNYRPEPGGKYVKLTTSSDSGSGLETWMLQVKTKEAAQALADALEANKAAGKQ